MASFCSLNETEETPDGYHENTNLMVRCAFALVLSIQWGFIFFFEPTHLLCIIELCMLSMTVYMFMIVLAFTNSIYDKNQTRLYCLLWPCGWVFDLRLIEKSLI